MVCSINFNCQIYALFYKILIGKFAFFLSSISISKCIYFLCFCCCCERHTFKKIQFKRNSPNFNPDPLSQQQCWSMTFYGVANTCKNLKRRFEGALHFLSNKIKSFSRNLSWAQRPRGGKEEVNLNFGGRCPLKLLVYHRMKTCLFLLPESSLNLLPLLCLHSLCICFVFFHLV